MAKPVEENYLITIKGTMEQNGENDTVELMTRGNFVQRGNSYYIVCLLYTSPSPRDA